MRTIISTLATAVIGLTFVGISTAIPSQADAPNHPPQHVPTWMRQACTHAHPVNCYHRGSEPSDERYVRQIPGRAHMVCVFYVTNPRHDYCA